MQPSEDSGLSALPSIELLTTAAITEQATSAVHDGYLVAQLGPRESTLGTASSANTSADQTLVQVTPIIKGELKPPLHWRNVVYTANWIVFALIVVYMWIRIVRDDLSLAQDADDVDRNDPEPESADLAQSKTD
jgi:hypothetical protein